VLLDGGSTLIGRVRERVTEFFEREPAGGVSPFEAVAVGAAIQACAMTEASTDDDDVPTLDALVMLRSIVSIPPPPMGRPSAGRIGPAAVIYPLGGDGASPANDPVLARVAKTDPPASMAVPRFVALPGSGARKELARRALHVAGWLFAGLLVLALVGMVWLVTR
jgi:hypothetical protein